MICTWRFAWGGPKMTLENVTKLNAVVREGMKHDPAAEDRSFFHQFTGDLREAIAAFPGEEIVVVTADVPALAWEQIMDSLKRIEATSGRVGPADRALNDRCQVHVPGLGLLLINEVMAEKDPCTDRLQEQLDLGWRILAVCPQPDQRRPDYILGRTKPNA